MGKNSSIDYKKQALCFNELLSADRYDWDSRYEDKDTIHSILTKTIKFLLEKNKQLTTEDIYILVQDIHPEMCDDNRKYKNGEKKWKIEVRQARFALQRKGIVAQVPNLPHTWTLLK
jgi:hypothetical protein